MLLSARPLRDVASVNNFRPADRWQMMEGDAPSLYLQLIDKSVDLPVENFNPPYRRYMPVAGATLQVTVMSNDMAKEIVRFATQPFPLDPSIWRLNLLSTDPVRGTVSMKLKLTEGGMVTYGQMQPALDVNPAGCM